MIAQAKSDASDAVFRLRVATRRDLHTITLVVPSEGGHSPVSILSHKLNRIHATRVEAFPVKHSRLAVGEEPLCHISEDFGSFPFLTLAEIHQAAIVEQQFARLNEFRD